MPLFQREEIYDRRRLLDRASRAARGRSRRKRLRALGLYRRVLKAEPGNPDVLLKVARLLAQTDQAKEACASYHRCAEAFVGQGFVERAIGVYRDAAGPLPLEVSIWKRIAELELKRGLAANAISALLEGRSGFRRRRERKQALELLWTARRIDPTHLELNLDLASLLGRCRAGSRGVALLEELVDGHRGCRARIRARQFRIQPTPVNAWRWFRAAFSAG